VAAIAVAKALLTFTIVPLSSITNQVVIASMISIHCFWLRMTADDALSENSARGLMSGNGAQGDGRIREESDQRNAVEGAIPERPKDASSPGCPVIMITDACG
jgi:hypothetical protein